LPFQVAWMHFEQSAILTVHNHVITRNPRISVTHDKHDKQRTWFLHINNVQEEDRGRYMCQINTVTAKTQYGFVKVVGMSLIGIEKLYYAPSWTLLLIFICKSYISPLIDRHIGPYFDRGNMKISLHENHTETCVWCNDVTT